MDSSAPSTSSGKRSRSTYTTAQALERVLESDEEDDFDQDYPADDLTDDNDDDYQPPNTQNRQSDDSDSDQDRSAVVDGGDATAPPPSKRPNVARPRPRVVNQNTGPNLGEGWGNNFTPANHQFDNNIVTGPRNLPDHITPDSTPLEFFSLFIGEDMWMLLCDETNRRAAQDKEIRPNGYYAKNFSQLSVRELKAFFALRLHMEQSVVKPRYVDYWNGEGKNFISHTPGFREVMPRDRWLGIWKYLHLVDEMDPTVNKNDAIYKSRPLLDYLMPKFRLHFSPRQHLSLDEGMIPTKNRLAIKQYIKAKPIKWGIKSFLLCESETGYMLHAEIYTGRNDDFIPELGAVGSVVYRLVRDGEVAHKNHILVMDRFYNSVTLFHYLQYQMGIFAVGTLLANRRFSPPAVTGGKRELTQRGNHIHRSRHNMSCVLWLDRQPILFLSTCHNPNKTGTVDRRNKDGTLINISIPEVASEYTKYMGGCDVNDQVTRLNKTRRHYRWPRRLIVKFFMWAAYNSFVIMKFTAQGKAPSFNQYLEQIGLGLVGDYRSAVQRRESRQDLPTRMMNVGVHFPESSPEATSNNICVVCAYKHNKFQKDYPGTKPNPNKKTKTTFWCGYCRRYLCIRKGSTCWRDWHEKVEYWH